MIERAPEDLTRAPKSNFTAQRARGSTELCPVSERQAHPVVDAPGPADPA